MNNLKGMKYLSPTLPSEIKEYFGHFVWKGHAFAWPKVNGQNITRFGQRAEYLNMTFLGVISEETREHSRKLFARRITHVYESADGMRTAGDIR